MPFNSNKNAKSKNHITENVPLLKTTPILSLYFLESGAGNMVAVLPIKIFERVFI